MIMLDQSLDHYIKSSSELDKVPIVWFQEWKGILMEENLTKTLGLLERNWPMVKKMNERPVATLFSDFFENTICDSDSRQSQKHI